MTNTALSAIALGGLVALRLWTWSNHHHSRVAEIDEPGAVIEVDAHGTAMVRGCGSNVEACLSATAGREYQRDGGGHYTVVIHNSAGSPSTAIDAATHRVIRAGLVPRVELVD